MFVKESCGNDAHIGYNCPPKAPIISNSEQCNQTIAEPPQTLPSVHPTCNYEDENSFTYDSKLNSFNDSPSVHHPPQLQFETYLCELCGNNAHYGYDCPPQFLFVYEQEPCYNQNFNDNYFLQNSQSSSQQYLCCENCGGPHETFQCQLMNEDYYEQNSCYYPNSFGFDQYQPSQFPVNAITTRSGKTCEGPSTPLVPTPIVSTPLKEPEQNPKTSMDKVQKSSSENTAQVLPPEDHDSIFIEILKPKAKKTVQEPNSPEHSSYQPKLPYPERMKVRERDTPNAQQSRTNALADFGASINLLPHSIYKQLGLGALKPTRMTLELANRSVTHPMGIAEDVVVRVDGFTFLADFVVVNFEPDPRVPIILGRPFLRTVKALIDLYEEKLTLRVGNGKLVFYAEKSKKSKNKQFAHAISVIDFLKDEPFSGSTTNHSDALPPSSSPVKTSDNLEEFADELTLLKKGVHEENFQVYSNPLFEFDDDFNSSNENPLFNEKEEDVENKNSNVSDSDESVLLNTPLTDKDILIQKECFAPEDDIDEIDAFLDMEVSSNFEEGYFDSEGDVIFLENLLSDDTTHNLAPEVISDHEPKQNESIHNTSITFSPRSDPLHHEFAGELITLPSRIAREHEEYLSRMTLLCEISTSQSQENVHANPSSIIESIPVSLIPVEDSDPVQEEIDIFLVPDDLIPPGVKNDDFEDEDNELPNLDHQDNPSSPRPPPEPPDVCLNFKPETAMKNDEDFNQGEIVLSLNIEDVNSFTFVIWTFFPFITYPEDSPVILSLRSEDLVFDPVIFIFHFYL
ncbi:reverse transcriptase domain-containing protein [Tanacetum coccineum]|uniref:Reverse transcriptase domain-containing protein n=1 Tax=Tanacetum coccineum TaxID=301880 RepID=A0ABQ5F039_9ASTR